MNSIHIYYTSEEFFLYKITEDKWTIHHFTRQNELFTGAAFSNASARESSPTKQYLWRHFLLFSRRTFAGARFAERSTVFWLLHSYDVLERFEKSRHLIG